MVWYLEYSRKSLYQDMIAFKNEMDQIDKNYEQQIASFCYKVEKYLYEHKLICKSYQLYQNDWEMFENNQNRNALEKSLFELFVYLFIYSREEHMSGGYGGSYVRAFQNGTIPDIIRGLENKLEKMSKHEEDVADKNGSIGIAGEYFVVAELTRRGYVASLTSKNTKSIDALVSDKSGNQVAAIQIKTCNNPNYQRWKMGSGAESNYAKSLYYVLVNLNAGAEPLYYVVPSEYVAYSVKQSYEEWLQTPGKKGQPHNETAMRIFEFVDEDEEEQFKNAWHLLGI